MMEPVIRIDDSGANPLEGHVRFDLTKTLWISVMLCGAVLALFHARMAAIILFLSLTYITLLLGHSVGVHRMMIHRTFKTSKSLQRTLIFIGVLVGMGGPLSIIKIHDMRDWAQRQAACHEFFSHEKSYVQDMFWQLFCRFDFDNPPEILIENDLLNDPYIRFFERHWRLIQIIFMGGLYVMGGWSWALWGGAMRVAVSICGHWTITYICHNPGPGAWQVKDAGVQASNLPLNAYLGGILSHGECWHNNHHAFPESAKIGLEDGQIDPAWAVISWMERRGWAYDVNRPRREDEREDLALRVG